MAIKYTTKPGEYAREYTATVGDLRINLDKVASDYLGWCIFIYTFDGPTPAESTVSETVYHSYAQTLKEAKERAQLFVDAAAILRPALA